jgi:DNA-binding CsgD family transcriptional regulator
MATAASALGRRFSLGELARMLDRSPASLIAPIEELVRADLLGECEGDLLFRHELTREAVRGSIPVSLLRALDRQAAELLLANGALPVEVAAQLAASAESGDELAITTLLKAAEALVSSNPGTAADLSQRALELAPAQHPLRPPLVAVTAVSLHAAGRAEEAKAFAETSLRSSLPAEQEAEVRFSIAGMFALSPDVRAEASRKALALDDLSAELRARHLARLVHNLYVADRPQAAHTMLDEAEVAVRASGDGLATFTLALAAGGLEYAGSRFRHSLEMIEAAARSGFATGDYTRERLAQEWRCELMMVLDYVDEPLQLAADNVAAAHRDRQGWVLQVFETWRGRMLLQLGQLNDAAAALDGRFDADNGAVVSILDAAGLVALGRSALHMGDAAQTRRTARIADQMLKQGVPGVKRHGAWLLALQAAAAGEPERARVLLAELDEPARTSILPRNPIDVTDDPQLVRIALAAGDRELAQHGVAAAEHRVQLNPDVRSIAASAAHAGGLLSGSEQDLASAVDLFRDIRRPIALASALEDLSQVRINSGERETGVQALDEALVVYDHAGAAWDASRTRGRLRALGVRRRLVSADRPDSGWAAMTQSELAVARLVAQGLTNREVAEQLFVSPNTVNSHLRQVFAKLQINSRVNLTRLALEQGRPA